MPKKHKKKVSYVSAEHQQMFSRLPVLPFQPTADSDFNMVMEDLCTRIRYVDMSDRLSLLTIQALGNLALELKKKLSTSQ